MARRGFRGFLALFSSAALLWAAMLLPFATMLLPFATTSAIAAAPLRELQIDTSSGTHVFKVEIARTEPEREKGLMFRRAMPQDHGMLFVYQTEEPVVFWMKNTYLPLDMLFIDHTGHIVSIKHDAKPLDESLIPSGAPSENVLELNAGVANAIGAKVGDAVHYLPASAGSR